MDKVIGFIGYGNMGHAMVNSVIRENLVPIEKIIVSKKEITQRTIARNTHKINIISDNIEVARQADILIIAVKPFIYEELLLEIKDVIKKEAIVISIAAGINLSFLKKNLNEGTKIVRAMPNTPALVGEGMTAFSLGCKLNDRDLADIEDIFDSFGMSQLIDEKLMDGVTSISASSPAYVYMMIEALADGGVREGIPRDLAYTFASQAVLGSAKMVLETGLHPGELKDKVCSPGGVTIEAVANLEKYGFRSAIIEAVKKCVDKSKEIGI